MMPNFAATSMCHYIKARIRRTMKAKEITYRKMRASLKQASHVLICVIRDENYRMPFFLQYYRNMGFQHFICIDNGSTDGTIERLSQMQDVSLITSAGSYKASRFGNDWINEVINRHCRNKWVLYVDADEFLVYPHCDSEPIQHLTDYMQATGSHSLRSMMVDMYSANPVRDNVCESGQDPLDICNLFDRCGYASHFDEASQTIWIKGGVRGRLYFGENIWNGPALNKVPLVYMGGERMFLKSTHQVWPLSLNRGQAHAPVAVSGALLHFKFFSTFIERTAEQLKRADASPEYEKYTERGDRESFLSNDSTRYKSWDDLADVGLLQGRGWANWQTATALEATATAPT
jgi:glycosyltransferase involved in cell wall biosynthesis